MVSSYYLRFRDAYRQAAIDLTVGRPLSPTLLRVSLEAAENGTYSVDDEEFIDVEREQLEKEENVRQVVEDCKRMLIVEPEHCLGGWSVVNADTVYVSTGIIVCCYR